MKTVLVHLLSHGVASLVCLVVFAFTPMVLYGLLVIAGILYNGDPGGLLNFIIVPVFSVGLALVTTFLILLPITLVLEWLSSRFRISRWWPLLGIFPISFIVLTTVVFLAYRPTNVGLALVLLVAWCVIGSICFALYWAVLNIVELVIKGLACFAQKLTKAAVSTVHA